MLLTQAGTWPILRRGWHVRFSSEYPASTVVRAALYPKWRRGPKGRLLAEIGEYRLEAYRCPEKARTAQFTVLRRQYGRGSPLALIDSGSAADLFAAMRAAERSGSRFL